MHEPPFPRLEFPDARRQPFRATETPWLARVFARAYRMPRGWLDQVSAPLLQGLFKWARRLSGVRTGRFEFTDAKGRCHLVAYDARNTQFESIYRPEYALAYEPDLCRLLDLLVAERGEFVDVGANWGYFSLYLLSRPGFQGRIHAFEPQGQVFEDLRQVVAQVSAQGAITCHRCALSNREGTVRMALPDEVQSGAALVHDGDTGETVPMQRLDDLALSPSFLKVDVEGHELQVLEGARDTIARHAPFIVLESGLDHAAHGGALAPLWLLESWGYHLYLPAWRDAGDDGSGCTFAFHRLYARSRNLNLVLIPLRAQDRPLFKPLLNVLAVPEAKVPLLARWPHVGR